MNNIIEHLHNGQRWLFVEVPEKFSDPEKAIDYRGEYILWPSYASNVEIELSNDEHGQIDLPQGTFGWQIVSKLSDITEEQAREMVERYGGKIFDYDPNEYWVYEDYTLTGHPFDSTTLTTAIQSLDSLIRSLGGDNSNEYLVLKEG